MDITPRIKDIVLQNLANDKYFLVDVIVSAGNGPKKILVLLDGDEGVNIGDCAKLSRAISQILEEEGEDIIDGAYTLDVSSPGLDHPLKLKRQYVNNIGRKVKVATNDGNTYTGKLLEVSDEAVVVNSEEKQGKKKSLKTISLAFEGIES